MTEEHRSDVEKTQGGTQAGSLSLSTIPHWATSRRTRWLGSSGKEQGETGGNCVGNKTPAEEPSSPYNAERALGQATTFKGNEAQVQLRFNKYAT